MQNDKVKGAGNSQVSIVCSNCGEVLKVSSGECIGKVHAELVDTGEDITLTYVSCGRCGGRSYVQVDNDKTLDRLDSVQRLLLAGKRKFAKKLDKELQEMRKELKLRVDGREVGLPGGVGECKQITLKLVM